MYPVIGDSANEGEGNSASQEEIEIFRKGRKHESKEITAGEIKTFQRYLSSINKASIVEVLDLPAAGLDY